MPVIDPEKVCGVSGRVATETLAKLTRREREVAELMADGIKNKVIAAQLGISPKTLDNHRSNICEKFGCDAIGVPRIVIAARIHSQGDE